MPAGFHRRPHRCCMSHSDELPSANALSALQHHLSGTLSLSPFRTVTRLHYLNLDLKHIVLLRLCFLTVLFASASEGNMALYKFCIVLYCIILRNVCHCDIVEIRFVVKLVIVQTFLSTNGLNFI